MDTIRQHFPILKRNPNWVYFDNCATTLKPKPVIDAVVDYYESMSVNIHRGEYPQALRATALYDGVRKKVAHFIGCDEDAVVFTTGTSEGLNLIAFGYGREILRKGDVIVLSEVEHASNVLPWFRLARDMGCIIRYIPLNDDLSLDLCALDTMMKTENVKIVSLAHVSNVVGKINDMKHIANIVHQKDAILVVDGAQSIGHMNIDVKDMDVDFFVFSSHKMMGPTAVGVLYGKTELLNQMEPLFLGGDSNARYYKDGVYTLKESPFKFETGTPNIEGVIGFGAAIDFLESIDLKQSKTHIQSLQTHILDKLQDMDHIRVHNSISDTGIILFNVVGIFAQDVAAYLGHHDICVRAGSHCSKLTCSIFDADNSVRASLYIYNTQEEADRFLEVLASITVERVVALYV